jgi:hypothetical protein
MDSPICGEKRRRGRGSGVKGINTSYINTSPRPPPAPPPHPLPLPFLSTQRQRQRQRERCTGETQGRRRRDALDPLCLRKARCFGHPTSTPPWGMFHDPGLSHRSPTSTSPLMLNTSAAAHRRYVLPPTSTVCSSGYTFGVPVPAPEVLRTVDMRRPPPPPAPPAAPAPVPWGIRRPWRWTPAAAAAAVAAVAEVVGLMNARSMLKCARAVSFSSFHKALKKCRNIVFSDCSSMKIVYPGTHEWELKQGHGIPKKKNPLCPFK